MDTQSTAILQQLLERMDKMDSQQYKLDRVMERLDTLQNILERQNQKQNLFDDKLVEVTTRRQQEKDGMIEQFKEALQKIVEPFHAIDSQGSSTRSPHKTTQLSQSLDTQIDNKLKSIDERTVDTAQTCHQLTLWLHKIEDKMTELTDKSVDMKTFLVEMRSVKDLIKGQTNSELIWLNNQIDKKLSDIGSVVRAIYQQQTEVKEETLRSNRHVVEYVKQQGNAKESLSDKSKLPTGMCDKQMRAIEELGRTMETSNSSFLEVPREIKTHLDTILKTNSQSIIDLENKNFEAVISELQMNTKRAIKESEAHSRGIISAVETAKEVLKKMIKTEGENTSKCKVELGNIHTLIDSVLVRVQGNLTSVETKIDSTEASILSRHATMDKQLEELTTHVNEKFKELTSDFKDYICNTKREIFAVTEKEAQIVRDRIKGPLQAPGKYTFDFYVNNFRTLVRSGKDVYSLPWHINELETCVTGQVEMTEEGEMEVWLSYGRHPREVGLQPRSGKKLKVKATICDIGENILPSLDIGEVDFDLNEDGGEWSGDAGCLVGEISCDTLLEQGYGYQEGYDDEALLIRYEVSLI